MSSLAHKHNAVNLSQGFPDFDPDPLLIELIAKAMKDGYNQYAPMAGIYSLREVISDKIKSLYGAVYHPGSEITITSGATQAIYTAIAAFISPGDEVIILKPAYDCYEPAVIANGGTPVPVQLQGKTYKIDWDLFRSKITERTKMVVINTPHNPSGRVFSSEDMLQLQQSLENTDILVLSDEVYEHLVFDDNVHESVSKFPSLAERSLVCASFGKTFHSTGWKMGYCAAPGPLMQEFQKIHEFNVFCVNHPIQRALAEYLKEPSNYLDLGPFFQQKRDHFLSSIRNSRFTFTPSQGTYFQLLEYGAISQERDVDLARRLTLDHKLASIPISVFNTSGEDHGQLRFCFAKTTETLDKAAAIINTL